MPCQNSHQPLLPSIHWHHLHTLADGDQHFAIALLRSFLTDGDRQLRELRQVIERGDYHQAHHYIHQIKGASANVGALRVEAIAVQMECHLQSRDSSPPEKSSLSPEDKITADPITMCLGELEKAIAQIRAIILEQFDEQ